MDFQGQFVNRMRLPQTGKGNKGAGKGKGKGKGKPYENPEIFLSDSSDSSVLAEPDAVCTRCGANCVYCEQVVLNEAYENWVRQGRPYGPRLRRPVRGPGP